MIETFYKGLFHIERKSSGHSSFWGFSSFVCGRECLYYNNDTFLETYFDLSIDHQRIASHILLFSFLSLQLFFFFIFFYGSHILLLVCYILGVFSIFMHFLYYKASNGYIPNWDEQRLYLCSKAYNINNRFCRVRYYYFIYLSSSEALTNG